MNKVIVIGCPGSGKSRFSKRFCAVTGIPLYHLDRVYWKPDGTHISGEELQQRLGEIMSSDRWLIDGNYGSTLEMRIQACDTVFFLDLPTEICLAGIRERKGTPRSDMPWISPDDDDAEFVLFVRNYRADSRPNVNSLLEKYADKEVFVFYSREDADAYLEGLEADSLSDNNLN